MASERVFTSWLEYRVACLTKLFETVYDSNVDDSKLEKVTRKILREINSKKVRANVPHADQHTTAMLEELYTRVVACQQRFGLDERRSSRQIKKTQSSSSVATTTTQPNQSNPGFISALVSLLVRAEEAVRHTIELGTTPIPSIDDLEALGPKTVNKIISVRELVCIPEMECDICCELREVMLETKCKHLICQSCLGRLVHPNCPRCRSKLSLN